MKKLFVIIIISLCFYACHKSTDTPLLEEHPMEDYIYHGGNAVSVIAMPGQEINDFGYQFSASKSGKIVKLGCRLPQLGDSAMVSLWDPNSYALLMQKKIKNSDPTNFIYANLQATNEVMTIPAFKNYLVSVHIYKKEKEAFSIFRLVRQDFKSIIPLTDQAITVNVLFEGKAYSPIPVFPTFVIPPADNNDVYGLVDIGFQADDF
jgi:hypothetical protein